jgi:hypothetical protein
MAQLVARKAGKYRLPMCPGNTTREYLDGIFHINSDLFASLVVDLPVVLLTFDYPSLR